MHKNLFKFLFQNKYSNQHIAMAVSSAQHMTYSLDIIMILVILTEIYLNHYFIFHNLHAKYFLLIVLFHWT